MGGNATFNLTSAYGVGLLEFSFGKDGISSRLGMGGTNVSFQNLRNVAAGATNLHKNHQINKTGYDKTTLDALRSQWGFGDEVAKTQLDSIIDGNTILKFDAVGSEVAQSIIENGQKIIHINTSQNENFIDLGLTLQHEAHRDGIVSDENTQIKETINAVLGHTVMAKKMQNDTLYKDMMNEIIANNQNLQNDLAVFEYAEQPGNWGIFGRYVNIAYDSSADYWRIIADETGNIVEVKDDGDDSILTLVDEEGNIKSVTMNDNTSLTGQIARLSQTNQTKSDINGIMVDSGLDFDKNKGWYAKTADGQYKVGQNVPDFQEMYRKVEVSLSEDAKSITARDITVFQEEIETALGLPHTACAIASVIMATDTFLLENYGIGARDSKQMIEILKHYATSAFVTTGDDAGFVKNLTALSAFYAQGLGMDDYLIFDDTYTSDKPNGYYIKKAYKLDDLGKRISSKTHFMTKTLFGYYDPDKGTNDRWWKTDTTSESVYRFATPKSSRIQ